uniref:Phosphomethylpyrimidine kinase (HMP-phosphate kinase) (HMP-P kinase) n=1 Tax=mine drainage metagenome TaxID=410659 RepID=E6PGJ2_9ZZZZ
MRAVLSIGTTHPWNVAGVGLDIRLGARTGNEVYSVVAAVSAQDAGGVRALHAVDLATLREQLACVLWAQIAAVRVGALPSAEHVALVAERIAAHPRLYAVVDPVLSASPGGALAAPGTLDALRERLLRVENVIATPNLAEAAALLGRPSIEREEMDEAARAILAFGGCAVVLTGGHLADEPRDVLVERARDRIRSESLAASRIPGKHRGTGCTLAFGIAAALADGASIGDALRSARALVRARLGEAL